MNADEVPQHIKDHVLRGKDGTPSPEERAVLQIGSDTILIPKQLADKIYNRT